MIKQLPHWCITDLHPAFHDTESLTVIEQTGRLYGKMQELVAAYNEYVEGLNKHIVEFENGTYESIEQFEIGIRQEFQDFIDVINLKVMNQDRVIQDAVNFMKDNLGESLKALIIEMRESGELGEVVIEAFQEVYAQLNSNKLTLDEHAELLNEHSTKLEEHTTQLNEYRTTLEEHTNQLDENSNTFKTCLTPKMYGAAGDGVTDDTESLQSCFDALHERNHTILDLGGLTYKINSPLLIKSMYGCTIRNGKLVSDNFNYSDNEEHNFIVNLIDEFDELQSPSSGGYVQEDNVWENITIDCCLQSNLGCFNIYTSYLRCIIEKCDFRRYTTYGIKFTDNTSLDGHEMIIDNCFFRANFRNEENLTGVGIYTTKADNIFSNLVIVGGAIGIKIASGQLNYYDTIHIYGCSEYGIHINNTNNNTFHSIYFDGSGLYMYKPYSNVFSNCYFLSNAPFQPIVLDKASGYQLLEGLVFSNCKCQFFQPSELNLVALPNGNFSVGTTGNPNKFEFICFNVKDNTQIFNSASYTDYTADVAFNETDYIANRSRLIKKDGWVHICYQGPAQTHAVDDLIMTLPSTCLPLIDEWFIPFISSNGYSGCLTISKSGLVKIGAISTEEAGRITINYSFPCA